MAPSDVDAVRDRFHELVGHPPAGVWTAPGRVNLIGEHTDYNDGFVMPFALEQRVTMAAGPRADGTWRVTSLNNDETIAFGPGDLRPGMDGWAAYVAGVVWALREEGHTVSGADLVLTSDVPIGAGLSSSAALECATLTAIADLDRLSIAPLRRAQLAQRCENDFVGAPTGLMDQAASTLCTARHALFFDCRTHATEQVALDPGTAGLEVLVLDTRTPHALVDSEYATRRASCEEASARLGIAALRDVDDLEAALGQLDDPEMQRRVRHVVTENARVLTAAQALRDHDFDALAGLLNASHTSMRDDYEITVPTVDLAVDEALRAGARGARMTGGGFGGCIIALVETGAGDRVAAAIAEAFDQAGHGAPSHFIATPAAGAGPAGT